MSAITKPVGALRGLGYPRGSFIVVDPGKRCGINIVSPAQARDHGAYFPLHVVDTVRLDELPSTLRYAMRSSDISFVVCEDYTLRGGTARNDPKMPSAQGIGMCRAICEHADVQMHLIQPSQKAPMSWFRPADTEARERCRNDHERDVVDLAVYVLRQLESVA